MKREFFETFDWMCGQICKQNDKKQADELMVQEYQKVDNALFQIWSYGGISSDAITKYRNRLKETLMKYMARNTSDSLADRIEEYTETHCKDCENYIVCEVHGWDCEELAEMHREYEEREVL